MDFEDLAKLSAVVAPFTSIAAAAAWTGFKAIMAELKSQTKTLAVLGERSSSNEVWKVSIESRVSTLEEHRSRDSGIRSVQQNGGQYGGESNRADDSSNEGNR